MSKYVILSLILVVFCGNLIADDIYSTKVSCKVDGLPDDCAGDETLEKPAGEIY